MNVVDCKEYSPLLSTNNWSCFLENLADFADDHGWTVDELKVGYNWQQASGGSGWQVGNQGFLQVHCDDVNFPMGYRFQVSSDLKSGNPYTLTTMVRDTYRTYSTNGSQGHPIKQNTENAPLNGFNLTATGFSPVKQWVLGNSKWILNVIQISALYCQSTFIGIPNLISHATATAAHIIWKTSMQAVYLDGYSTPWPPYASSWENIPNTSILSGPWSKELGGTKEAQFAGSSQMQNIYGYLASNLHNVTRMGGDNASSAGVGFTVNKLLKTQTWSNKRMIVVPLIYTHTTSKQFTPFAYMPIGMIRFSGLDIGQVLTYGSEEYKIFPFNSSHTPEGASGADRHCAWAVRIK